MNARKRIALCLAVLLLPTAAPAHEPKPVPGEPETVTSEAARENFDRTVHDFVKSLAAPSPFSQKVAQWNPKIPLCPKTASPSPSLNDFVTQRIRQVAVMVGAPLSKKEPCTPNMIVVFTDYPQPLLDEVRAQAPRILGYVTTAERERAATVNHAIQGWYGTYTEDLLGVKSLDDADGCCRVGRVTGSHTRDGLRSGLATVLVVVDTSKTANYTRAATADYLALLTLTQTRSFDGCRGMASIANLMAEGCDAGTVADALTENDIAYLKALYQMNPDNGMERQVFGIASEMEDTLAKH